MANYLLAGRGVELRARTVGTDGSQRKAWKLEIMKNVASGKDGCAENSMNTWITRRMSVPLWVLLWRRHSKIWHLVCSTI